MNGLPVFLINFVVMYLLSVNGSKLIYRLVVPPSQRSLTGLTVFTTVNGNSQLGNVQSFAEGGGIQDEKTFQTSKSNHSVLSLNGTQHILRFHSDQAVSRVKLNSPHLVNSEAYQPLPDACLGSLYRVSTMGPEHGEAFVVFVSKGRLTKVKVTLGSNLPGTKVTFNDQEYGPGQEFTVKVLGNQMQILTSKYHALDGLQLTSSHPVAVFAGNVGTQTNSTSQSNTLIETIPPYEIAGTKHVIVLPGGAESAKVKIINFYANTHVTLKEFKGIDTSLQEKHLESSSQTWIYDQTNSIYLISNKPVLVVQYIYSGEERIRAMTVIPPSRNWVKSYQLHPLTDSSDTMRHMADIVIQTKHLEGFIGTSLVNGSDITSLIDWQRIGQSDFSSVQIDLNDNGLISLSHFDPNVKFQVILTGYGVDGGFYALPGGMAASDGRDILDETDTVTEDNDRSTKNPILSRHKRAVFLSSTNPMDLDTDKPLVIPLLNRPAFVNIIVPGTGSTWFATSSTTPWWWWSSSTDPTTVEAVDVNDVSEEVEEEEADDQTTLIAAGAATAGAAAVAAIVVVVIVVKTSAASAIAPAGTAAGKTAAGVAQGVTSTKYAVNGSAPLATGQTVGTFHSGMSANGFSGTASKYGVVDVGPV